MGSWLAGQRRIVRWLSGALSGNARRRRWWARALRAGHPSRLMRCDSAAVSRVSTGGQDSAEMETEEESDGRGGLDVAPEAPPRPPLRHLPMRRCSSAHLSTSAAQSDSQHSPVYPHAVLLSLHRSTSTFSPRLLAAAVRRLFASSFTSLPSTPLSQLSLLPPDARPASLHPLLTSTPPFPTSYLSPS